MVKEVVKGLKHLNIPNRPVSWRAHHASLAIKKTVLFLNHYFIDQLGWSIDHCMLALCSHHANGQDVTVVYPERQFNELRVAELQLRTKIRFLDLALESLQAEEKQSS